jgi:hypothetical protein
MRMSDFEASALMWYWENATGWAARMGITGREFERLRLRGIARSLFLKAMQMIEEAYKEISGKQSRG